MNKKFNFFKEAIKNYKTSGTIAPSSRFLANKMIKPINFSNADLIVELGPGNGAVTKFILNKIKPETTLVCFEINDGFYLELLKMNHPQLIVLKTSAENINEELQKLGFAKADYVVSSLPLSILPKSLSVSILNESFKVLKEKGLFMQFQYSLFSYKELKKIFGKHITLNFEPINFPPAFIYKCSKNSTLVKK